CITQPTGRDTARSTRSRTATRTQVCRTFFFNDTATTEIYTLSLHDALPISKCQLGREVLSEELGLQKLLKGREGRPILLLVLGSSFHQRGTTCKFWIAVLAQTAVPNDAH